MANPINPVGRRIYEDSGDILENARRQDRERNIREDNEIFERTGINREPQIEREFLVPINGSEPEDIADDGDNYDETQTLNIDSDFLNSFINTIGGSNRFSQNTERQEYLRREQIRKQDEKIKEEKEMRELREKATVNNAIMAIAL